MNTRQIHCCGCNAKVKARLTNGREIYPHRPDLYALPFWKCDACGNFVGCHHKTKDRTRPLGCIPTPEIKAARVHLHALIDQAWKGGKIRRGELYKAIGKRIGREYHSAHIRSVDEARAAYKAAQEIIRGLP